MLGDKVMNVQRITGAVSLCSGGTAIMNRVEV